MNKRRKIKKSIVTIAAIAITGVSCISIPSTSFASEYKSTEISQQLNQGIVNIEKELTKLGHYHYINDYANQIRVIDNVKYQYHKEPKDINVNLKVLESKAEASNIRSQGSKPEFIGENTFKNDSGVTQTYATAEYQKTVKEGNSVSVSEGFELGESVNIKVDIPLVGSVGTTISAKFDTSTTKEQTHEVSKTLIAPAQSVTVPPNKTYKAEVVLNQEEYTADIDFHTLIESPTASIRANITRLSDGKVGYQDIKTIPLAYYMNDLKPDQKKDININFWGENVKQQGKATIKGATGAELLVKIYDVTNLSEPKLVETRAIN